MPRTMGVTPSRKRGIYVLSTPFESNESDRDSTSSSARSSVGDVQQPTDNLCTFTQQKSKKHVTWNLAITENVRDVPKGGFATEIITKNVGRVLCASIVNPQVQPIAMMRSVAPVLPVGASELQLSDKVLSYGFIMTSENDKPLPIGLDIHLLESQLAALHIPLHIDNQGHLGLSVISHSGNCLSFDIKIDRLFMLFVPLRILDRKEHQRQLSLVMNLLDSLTFENIVLRPSRIYRPSSMVMNEEVP
eukprot:CCRYP_020233-RA/>CCRYP_020233-RA protein AED:0.84 eAED:0.85 QI:0/0/0/0.66/1/1/3/0/246